MVRHSRAIVNRIFCGRDGLIPLVIAEQSGSAGDIRDSSSSLLRFRREALRLEG
jgi:hypothetical protein